MLAPLCRNNRKDSPTYRVVDRVWNPTRNKGGYLIGWVCKHCGSKTITVYIATSHDHTDTSVDMCTCGKGKRFQDVWPEKTKYCHPTHPMSYYKEYFA